MILVFEELSGKCLGWMFCLWIVDGGPPLISRNPSISSSEVSVSIEEASDNCKVLWRQATSIKLLLRQWKD